MLLHRRKFIKKIVQVPFAWLVVRYLKADHLKEGEMIEKLILTQQEWKERLTEEEFYILRKEGTEKAFSHELDQEKRKGVYLCRGCGLDLFDSEMKFDSGTGWPSFFDHIKGHLEIKKDYRLFYPRTEYHCARCEGHHGHVFDDGPSPTGERWCNNGLALNFVPQENKDKID